MKNEALKQLSDKIVTLSGEILDLKAALDGIEGLLYDVAPQDKTSREQLGKITALMTGVKLMASNASYLACELEKEVPSTDTEDKN